MTITGKAKVAGVVGWPIEHSLSPILHGFWLRELGIDGAMVPLRAPPGKLRSVISGVRDAGFRGVNVTVPYKEAAFRLADFHDTAASLSKAANLLVFHDDGSIEGKNTDTFGLAASLEDALGKNALSGKTVVILGAGGAARAAALALNYPGKAARIHVLARNQLRLGRLIRDLSRSTGTGKLKAEYIPGRFADWPELSSHAALLVNATTLGMTGMPPLNISLRNLPSSSAVCDVVYTPRETNLLRRAKVRGNKVIDGLGMLMYQAAPSFSSFFDARPEVTPGLRKFLIRALRQRDA